MKRIICAIIIVTMLISLFACQSGNNNAAPSTTAAAATTTTAAGTEAAEAATTAEGTEASATTAQETTVSATTASGSSAEPESQYAEKLTISWVYSGISEGVDYTGDDFGKYLCERFNFEPDVIACTFDNWVERMRIWINSGDMPEVCTYDFYNYSELARYAEEDAVYRLPDDWEQRWTNVSSAQGYVPAADIVRNNLGGTYILLRPVFSTNKPVDKLSYHMLMYMRKDWMLACGVELKDTYTIGEFIEIARLFKENDPGNIGPGLIPICADNGNMMHLLPRQIYTRAISEVFYIGDDGKYHWGPADEPTLEGLLLYKQIYDEGLLDPEFYTLELSFGDQYKFYGEGNVGMVTADGMAGRMTLFESNLRDNLNLEFDDVIHIAQPVGNDGKYHQAEQANYWASVIFAPDIKQNVFERAMDIIDFQASVEGQRFLNMGFEGVDWEFGPDGDYVNLRPAGQRLSEKYPSANGAWGSSLCLGDNFAFESPANKKEYRDTVTKFYLLRDELGQDNTTFVDIDYNVLFYTSPARSQASMELREEYAQLVLMDGDLETNWRKWVDEKMLVIQPVIDELNEAFT